MPEITVYTVPDCADCQAVKRLLTHYGAVYTERNIRHDPDALAELQRRANVRIAPVIMIGFRAFYGPFDQVRPRLTAALEQLKGTG